MKKIHFLKTIYTLNSSQFLSPDNLVTQCSLATARKKRHIYLLPFIVVSLVKQWKNNKVWNSSWLSDRHLPIVLVKVAYYASGSARFLPKLCSNYARFSKLCYFFKNYSVHISDITRPLLLYFPVVDSRRLSRASCAGFGLSSLFSLPCKLSGCSLHLTGLAWLPPFWNEHWEKD